MSNLNNTGLTRVLTYLKTWITGLLSGKSDTSHTHSDYIPNSGTTSITGTGFFKSTSDSQLQIGSGTSTTTGGCFVAYGSEYSNSELAGSFRLRARTTANYDLIGYANGTLSWSGKNIDCVEEQGNDYIRYASGLQICWGVISSEQFEPFNDHYGKLVSYPKSFLANTEPVVNISQWRATGNLTQNVNIAGVSISYVKIETDEPWGVYYTVFGKWK